MLAIFRYYCVSGNSEVQGEEERQETAGRWSNEAHTVFAGTWFWEPQTITICFVVTSKVTDHRSL